jgi:hypothetical protein
MPNYPIEDSSMILAGLKLVISSGLFANSSIKQPDSELAHRMTSPPESAKD